MTLFKTKKKNTNYTIIVGCGRLGANLADTLSDEDGDVLIINKDKNSFRKLSSSFGGLFVAGDASDLDVLKEARMDKADVVVAVTDNDNVNIIVAQLAREMFHINRVIARLYDPDRECVYQEFGIDTICPALLSANAIAKILSQEKTDAKTLGAIPDVRFIQEENKG